MGNNLVHQFGKLSQAVGVLVTHPCDARHRVWGASEYILTMSPETVPESCREDVAWIQHMLTRRCSESPRESDLQATFRRTRNVTACKIAQRIWTLYHLMQTEVDEYFKRAED